MWVLQLTYVFIISSVIEDVFSTITINTPLQTWEDVTEGIPINILWSNSDTTGTTSVSVAGESPGCGNAGGPGNSYLSTQDNTANGQFIWTPPKTLIGDNCTVVVGGVLSPYFVVKEAEDVQTSTQRAAATSHSTTSEQDTPAPVTTSQPSSTSPIINSQNPILSTEVATSSTETLPLSSSVNNPSTVTISLTATNLATSSVPFFSQQSISPSPTQTLSSVTFPASTSTIPSPDTPHKSSLSIILGTTFGAILGIFIFIMLLIIYCYNKRTLAALKLASMQRNSKVGFVEKVELDTGDGRKDRFEIWGSKMLGNKFKVELSGRRSAVELPAPAHEPVELEGCVPKSDHYLDNS